MSHTAWHDDVPVMLFALDTAGRVVAANRFAAERLGYDQEELVGAPFAGFVLPDDRENLPYRSTWSARMTGRIERADLRLAARDGSTFWVEGAFRTVTTSDDEAVRLASCTDISARRGAETIVHESNSFLRAIVEGTGDAVYLKDRRGRYLMINPVVTRLIGRTPEDIIGKDDTHLFEPATAEGMREQDLRVMTLGTSLTYEESIEASTGARTYLTTMDAFTDGNGAIVGVIGISRDITDHKQAEEALRQSDEQLRQAQRMEAVGRLAG